MGWGEGREGEGGVESYVGLGIGRLSPKAFEVSVVDVYSGVLCCAMCYFVLCMLWYDMCYDTMLCCALL